MTRRSVRWGTAHRLVTATAVLVGAAPADEMLKGATALHESKQDPRSLSAVTTNASVVFFGADTLQSYQVDPLAAAAETYRRGLVVVLSGGNEGEGAGRLTDPALDLYAGWTSARWFGVGQRSARWSDGAWN